MPHVNVVLLEPEIPQNTGNIARTCAATGSSLHLIRPLGYKIDDTKLKRAGMDYWYSLDLHFYDNWEHFLRENLNASFYLFSKKAAHTHTEIPYPDNVFLVFGRESVGLPEDLLRQYPERCIRIPMLEGMRSLNLSNAAAIAVYEVLRQHDFSGLLPDGGFFS